MIGEAALRRESVGAALLLVVAASLRLVHLDRGITGDEVVLYELARRPVAEIYGAAVSQEVYSPLGAYLLHFWMGLGTGGEVWARLYFVLFGVGLCAVVYYLGRELLGSRGALLALAAAALSPLLIAVSQYMRSYSDAAFWSALGLLALVRIWRGRGARGAWLLYAGATLVAFYTFYFTLLVWAAVILWLSWRLWREVRPWRPWVTAHVVMAAGIVPGLVMALYQIRHNASATRFNWSGTGFQLAGVHVGVLGRNVLAVLGFDPAFGVPGLSRLLPIWELVLLLAAVLAACAVPLSLGWRRLQAGGVPSGASLCLAVALFPVVGAQISGEWFGLFANAKYLLVSHVLFLLIMVAAVLALPRRTLAVTAGTVVALAYGSRLEAVYRPEYDALAVHRFIATTQDPGTIVLLWGHLPTVRDSVVPARSLDVHALVRYDYKAGRYRLEDRRALETALAGFRRVMYVRVYSNQEVFGGNALILDYLAADGFVLQDTKRFQNIDVMIFNKPRPDGARPESLTGDAP